MVRARQLRTCPDRSFLPRHWREDGTCRHHPVGPVARALTDGELDRVLAAAEAYPLDGAEAVAATCVEVLRILADVDELPDGFDPTTVRIPEEQWHQLCGHVVTIGRTRAVGRPQRIRDEAGVNAGLAFVSYGPGWFR